MSRPFLLAQLTDCHIGADGGRVAPAAALVGAVDALLAAPDQPDAVLVTGDLAHRGKRKQYTVVRTQLERLGVPWIVLAGNHDRRDRLREVFERPGGDHDPIHQATDIGPLRVVTLDTTVPGEDHGRLPDAELVWLDQALSRAPERPTIVAMHHPPVVTGVRPWDDTAIPTAQQASLARVLAHHSQVRTVVAGHLHRALVTSIAGRPMMVVPSTYLQSWLDWSCDDFVLVPEPPAFALHALRDGELVSHLQPIA